MGRGAQAGDIVLLGHSWGAWLVLLYTARYPELVRKVVLVGAGPLEVHYVPEIMQRRLRRLDHSEKEHFARLINNLGNTNQKNLQQLQKLLIKTENYSSLIPLECGCPEMDQSIYADVWPEAEDLRQSAEKQIRNALAMQQFIHDYNITVSDEDIDARQAEILSHYNNPKMQENFKTPEARRHMHEQLLTDRAHAKLAELNEGK